MEAYMSDFHVVPLHAFVRALKTPHMQPLQRAVLGAIASGRGRPINHTDLVNMVWGQRWRDGEVWEQRSIDSGPEAGDIALRVMIFRLRKLGYNIKNRNGFGYYLEPDRG